MREARSPENTSTQVLLSPPLGLDLSWKCHHGHDSDYVSPVRQLYLLPKDSHCSTVPRRSYVRLIAARDFPSCRQCLFLEKLAEIRSREQNVLGSLVTHFPSILEHHGPRAMWFVYRRTSQCMCSH
jgi:hypothetical protein